MQSAPKRRTAPEMTERKVATETEWTGVRGIPVPTGGFVGDVVVSARVVL